MAIALRSRAEQTAPGARSLNADLQGHLESPGRPLLRSGMLQLDRARIDLTDRSRPGQVLGGEWQNLQPLRLRWQTGSAPRVEADAVRWRLQPRLPGLVVCTAMGSRGIGWAALAGQLVASLALGSPRPLEADLLDAVDPLRFALRRQRKAAH